jgi:hypothetical protein
VMNRAISLPSPMLKQQKLYHRGDVCVGSFATDLCPVCPLWVKCPL